MRAFLLAFLLLGGCGLFSSGPSSPYLRISVQETGRVYYARIDRAIHSQAGGFFTFRDLVTKEDVRLTNGTYIALECPRQEVSIRQQEYLENGKKPRIEDYEKATAAQ